MTKIDTSDENDIIFVACHFFVKFLQHDIDDVQCEQKKSTPCGFLTFSQTVFLINCLHTYYTFLSIHVLDTNFYSIISNFDEVMPY